MRELSLFTGAGGGLLGSHLLGWTPVGYVEYDDYCQQIIALRIADGILPEAPIFGDIKTFISEGYADSYSGLVDIVTAGFPCQPFSVAGKGEAENDPRNKWPETIDVIRRVRPRFAYLENPPGLLAREYIRRIYGDLAESGYDCRWRCLSAAELGAPHRRQRWWCVAHSNSDRKLQPEGNEQELGGRIGDGGTEISDNGRIGLQGSWWTFDPGYSTENEHREKYRAFNDGRWSAEPPMGRVAHGVASRMDRLRAIGNGQVPAVAATAFRLLSRSTD